MVNIFEDRKIEGESAVTNSVKNVIARAQIQYDDFSVNDEIFEDVIVLKKDQPAKEKMIRVYRGLVKCDRSILEQLPFALRKIVEHSGDFNLKKLQELKEEVTELANNLTYEKFLKYVERVRPLLQPDEKIHLDNDLAKIEKRVILGNPISEIITQLQFLHARGSSRSGVSPFVSATTDPHEAARYGNVVAVLDVPVSMVSQIAGPRHGEVMLRGVVDQKHVTAYLTKYDKPFSKDEKLYNGVDKALEVLAEHDKNPIFAEKESLAVRKKQFIGEKAKRKKQYEKDLEFVLTQRENKV